MFKRADEARPDEKLTFSPQRNSIICAARNFIHGLFAPMLGLSGPSWTGGQVLVINRYASNPRKVVDSYWGGATSIYWGMSIAMMFVPIVSLLKPGLNLGMVITLLIQGYLCGYLAIEMLAKRSNVERGVAIMIGAILAVKGATWGLGIGIMLYLLLERNWLKGRGAEAVAEPEQGPEES